MCVRCIKGAWAAFTNMHSHNYFPSKCPQLQHERSHTCSRQPNSCCVQAVTSIRGLFPPVNYLFHKSVNNPRSTTRTSHTTRRSILVHTLQTIIMLSALQNPRQAAAQVLNFALILSTAFMMWKGLSVIADSPSPIVVVLSGSMEPAFQRGDLLFLWNRNFFEETKVGEIVVYNVKGKDIPIVHRLVRKFGTG